MRFVHCVLLGSPRGAATASRDVHLSEDHLSDEQLFERFRGGDAAALRTLIERQHDDLLRFLARLTGDRTAADDIFQETFLQVYQSADTFDTSRRFRPWLFTIAANKARDWLRKRSRRKTVELSAPVGGGVESRSASFVDLMEIDIQPPDAAMDIDERDRLVQRALEELQPALKEILLLAYFQRLSYAQIAEDLGIPLGTVKSRLHSAVASFARAWKRVSKELD